jgi:ABC-type multidrug transport system fused ATPase/permease subunit
VAHRLSTIREATRVIVLDKGRIVEDGGYDELVAKGGLFAELVSRQQID